MVFGKKAAAPTKPQSVDPVPAQELPPTSAQVAAQLEQARVEAERRAEEAEATRLAYEDDPSREAKDRELSAIIERDIAATRVRRLERELTEAEEREAEQARQRLYDDAAEHERAIPERFRRFDELSAALAALAAELVEGDRLIEVSNRDRPKDAARLRKAEEFRGIPSHTDRKVVRCEGWATKSGERYSGPVSLNEHGQPNIHGLQRATWDEVQETFSPAFQPPPLLTELRLPGTNGKAHWPVKG